MEKLLGADALQRSFGITGLNIPMIPFTEERVTWEFGLGHHLIYRTDTAGDGKPLTMDKIVGLLQNTLCDGNLIYPAEWYARDPFFTQKVPKKGWRFVSGDIIPASSGKNPFDQTAALVDYLVTKVYAGQELPAVYQTAVDEYERKVNGLGQLASSNWKEHIRQCMALQINQLFRGEPVDVLYDIVVQYRVNNRELYKGKRVCTAGFSAEGYPVVVPGRTALAGIILSQTKDHWPCSSDGVCFSHGPIPTA